MLATNETHTVQEFCEVAFGHVGLDWKEFVKYDARYERPAEVDLLIGDPAKAKAKLGWEPKTQVQGTRPSSWSMPTSRCSKASRSTSCD